MESAKNTIRMETQRLCLRNVAPKDAPIMFDYRNDERCAKYQRGQTKTLDGILRLIEAHKADTISADRNCLITVALRSTDEMIGEIVVMPSEQTFSFGYTFHYQHHRKGYAYEAISALQDLLHKDYPDWEFICFTDPKNIASMALLRKLGYRDMGYLSGRDSHVFGKWTTPQTDLEIAQLTARK